MRALAALLISAPLLAQGVSVGIRAGVPITPALAAVGPEKALPSRFTIGPIFEFQLWHGAAFEADILFRRTGLVASPGSQRAKVWLGEAPITIVYRFRVPVRPFVRAGVSFNRVLSVGGATECARGPFGEQFYCLEGNSVAELRHRSTHGFVAGGGFRFQLSGLWLESEVRLTHWFDRNFGVRDSALRSNLNQVALLMGVIF